MKNNITKIIIALAIFLPGSVFATNLSYVPRVYLDGYTGTTNLLGKADVLAPIYLTANNNLFAYAQGKCGYEDKSWEDNTYTGSFGLGFRQIVKDTTVLGAYVLGDYSSSTSGHNFWVLSPGIESLGRNWVFRANGYFPVSKTRWVDKGWASEFGDYHYIELTKNQQWDHWYQYYQETGPGADAEVGRNLFMLKGMFKGVLFKGFLNGYYYNMKHTEDVVGVGARLTMQPNQASKISLRYSYDNYEHSTFMVGIQLSFYDLISENRNNPIEVKDLQRNLFIPIERNLATIGTGSSTPVTRSDAPEDLGQRLEYDNVWFFNPGPSSAAANSEGSGTAEDPFRVFTKTTYDQINPSVGKDAVRLYFAANHIFNLGSFETAGQQYRFELPAGWMMQGWFMAAGEKQNNRPATGEDRPIFVGGFKLNSNSSINNLRLQNVPVTNAALDIGVKIHDSTNVVMNDITVGNDNSMDGSYKTGTSLDNSDLTINASQIYGYSINDVASGIEAINEGGNTITATNGSLIEGRSVNNSGFGIKLLPNAISKDIKLGAIIGDKTALFEGMGIGSGVGGVGGCGLYAATGGGGNVDINTISGSTFNGSGTTGDGWYSAGGCGLYAATGGGGNVDINTISGSTFTGDGTAGDGSFSVGGCGLLATTINNNININTISGSTFTGDGTAGDGSFSVGGCGLSVRTLSFATSGVYNIYIDTISSSTFTGNNGAAGDGSFSAGGCGLYAFCDGNVDINTISGSTFAGDGTAGDGDYSAGGCGLYANDGFGAVKVNINTISGSTFVGTGFVGSGTNSTAGCGLYAHTYGIGTITLGKTTGSIVNNDFRGSTDVGIWLIGNTPMTINGNINVGITDEARTALSGWGNQFDPDPGDIRIN